MKSAAPEEIIAGFGPRLAVLLKRRGWKAADLARESGVAAPIISRLLQEKRSVELATLMKLAAALGMSIDELLGRKTPRRHAS